MTKKTLSSNPESSAITTKNAQSHSIPPLKPEELSGLADLFKTFGDVTRLRIMETLSHKGELCVNDLADELSMTQSAVSHQLKGLKLAHLVKSRRDGKQVYYALDDDHVQSILEKGAEHVLERHTL